MALCQQIPLVSTLMHAMLVLVKGVGMNLANISAVPFNFAEVNMLHPFFTPKELAYRLAQQLSWQALAQVGKLLGHSDMIGNPFGLAATVGSGVAGFVRGVGKGLAHGDGEAVLSGGKHLLGGVVGGVAGAGARFTGSLHSVVRQMNRGGPPGARLAASSRRGVGGYDNWDSLREGSRMALRTLHRGFRGLLLRPLEGAREQGALGLAQGISDGVWGFALSPVAATLQAGSVVLSTVERAALGGLSASAPPLHLRPARSFFSAEALHPLAECMMTSLEVCVVGLCGSALEQGSVHVEMLVYEPGEAQARQRSTTASRGWLQGFAWEHTERYRVRSLDARLMLRVWHKSGPSRIGRIRCLGMMTVRLSTIRALCKPRAVGGGGEGRGSLVDGGATGGGGGGGGGGGESARGGRSPGRSVAAAGAEPHAAELCDAPVVSESGVRWFALNERRKRRVALQAEERRGGLHAEDRLGGLFGDSYDAHASGRASPTAAMPSSRGSFSNGASIDADGRGGSQSLDWEAAETEALLLSGSPITLSRSWSELGGLGEAGGLSDAGGLSSRRDCLSPEHVRVSTDGAVAPSPLLSEMPPFNSPLGTSPEAAVLHSPSALGVPLTPARRRGTLASSVAFAGGLASPAAARAGNALIDEEAVLRTIGDGGSDGDGAGSGMGAPFSLCLRFRCWTDCDWGGRSTAEPVGTPLARDGGGDEERISPPSGCGRNAGSAPVRGNLGGGRGDGGGGGRGDGGDGGGADGGSDGSGADGGGGDGGDGGHLNPVAQRRPASAMQSPLSELPEAPDGLGSQGERATLMRVVDFRPVRSVELGAKSFVMYKLAVGGGNSFEGSDLLLGAPLGTPGTLAPSPLTGWVVKRRFSQFVQLHEELKVQQAAALLISLAQMPSKFRFPSGSLEAEGAQRMAPLQAYLSALLSNETLRKSQPLLYFVGAHQNVHRRLLWQRLTTSTPMSR